MARCRDNNDIHYYNNLDGPYGKEDSKGVITGS